MSTTQTTTDSGHLQRRRRALHRTATGAAVLVVLLLAAALGARLWLSHALRASLPQTDGSLRLQGLASPVTVERDAHGIPHILAESVDDLVFAQGFVTAGDRLWQMDMLRRHVTGRLAEVLGSDMVEHDRTQRYLQLRQAAARALPLMDPAERHQLDRYADGVNVQMDLLRAGGHLPAEFRVLGYEPERWTAMDSLLVEFAMTEDLSTVYPSKLDREAVETLLAGHTSRGEDLLGDLYPVTTLRDHPPLAGAAAVANRPNPDDLGEDDEVTQLASPSHVQDLLDAKAVLAPFVGSLQCGECQAGSNNWAVSGAHTQSGKPLVANDPHLSLTVPGIWYTVELESGSFHASGAAIPGLPFLVIGHNQHVAWGFTNSTADVQDLYVEQVSGNHYRGADGATYPLEHDHETIRVKRGKSVSFDVLLTSHGGVPTPILSPLYPHETRSVALRWPVYEAAIASLPMYRVCSAEDGAALLEAFRNYGAPAQNLVWGDDRGHIGYHLVGRIPLRGADGQSGLTPVPVNTGTYEWTGWIPYDALPQVTDPEDGVVATANARTTPTGYPYGITLDWAAPYRNERIWKLLEGRNALTAADMLAVQNDTFSALDKVYAEHIVSAVDHAESPTRREREAADILRKWDGHITADSTAASLTAATRRALLPMVLQPKLGSSWDLYGAGNSSYVLERMIETQPSQWLPEQFADWNALLTAALDRGMKDNGATAELRDWTWGSWHTLDLEHPVFGAIPWLRALLGIGGTGAQPMPGSGVTVRASNGKHSASMRFIADLAEPTKDSLSLPMGESGNPASPWFMDGWSTWYRGQRQDLPFAGSANSVSLHRMVLTP
ncbi:penicillin acylase family protein [Terriglobus roseus]|uniref:penicillin acylase family protein n=1 Tax=Terriglobus roseus TaxID=392734 RepID=UPI0009F2B1D2|nr:penicillin acylase family protein [Terriglobus roseus]